MRRIRVHMTKGLAGRDKGDPPSTVDLRRRFVRAAVGKCQSLIYRMSSRCMRPNSQTASNEGTSVAYLHQHLILNRITGREHPVPRPHLQPHPFLHHLQALRCQNTTQRSPVHQTLHQRHHPLHRPSQTQMYPLHRPRPRTRHKLPHRPHRQNLRLKLPHKIL
jgi:hypothetical protein